MKALEEGFRSVAANEEAGLPPCVGLVNSVASAEIPRLNHLLKNHQKQETQSPSKIKKPRSEDPPIIPSSQILLSKIFLKKTV